MHVQLLSRELVKRGHQIVVGTIGQRGLPEVEEEVGIKILRLNGFFQKLPLLFKDPKQKWHPPSRDWLISNEIARIVERERPDIVHTHCWFLHSVLPLKNKSKMPLVHTIHDYGLFCVKRAAIRRGLVCGYPSIRRCAPCMSNAYGLIMFLPAYYGMKANLRKLALVDKFIAVSDSARDVNRRNLNIDDDDILTIPNFTEPHPEIVKEEADKEFPNDFILYAGCLAPYKGVDVLIEAYRKLSTKTKLLLIGIEHPDYNYMSNGNIIVLKNKPQTFVLKAMAKCRFTVVPSICLDTCPTVALEAMSQCKAIVASSIGGLTDIVLNEETGIHVPPNRTDELAHAMERLLNNKEMALQMGKAAYKRFIAKYTPQAVIPRVLAAYESVISATNQPSSKL